MEQKETVDSAGMHTESAEEQPTSEALAEDFSALQQQVPEFTSMDCVPKEVLKVAEEQHISRFDAYLRYRFYEQQAIAAEQERRAFAAACSAGSLQTGALRAAPVADAFARAFEKALS